MSDNMAFLAGGGEAARMIRARDWSGHPLGRPEIWPTELRTALSLVLNSPESMILAWGPELHFLFNDAYAPLLGPRLSWAMGERFDVVWADAWEQAKPIIDDAFAGRSRRFDDLLWKLGTDRGPAETWFSFSYSRVLDGEGRVAGLFIFTNETTARVLADRALRESEEHFRQTVELNPQVPWTCDPQGNVTSYSHRWLELTGQGPGEPDGAGWTKALHPDDLEPTAAVFTTRLASGEPVDVDYRIRIAATGEYRWQRARAYRRRDDAGAIIRWYGVVEDIHDQKLAEAALRESEEELRLVVESARDHVILTTDTDGVITRWSAGAQAVLGWSSEEAVGQPTAITFTPEDREKDADLREIATAARNGCAADERWHLAKDGRHVFLNGSVHPLPPDAQGRPRGFLKVARDETARIRAEEARRASEAQLRLVADALPLLVSFVDRTLTYRFANAAYRDWFERTPDEVIGRRVHDLVDEEGFRARLPHMERALAGTPVRLDLPWPWPDGRRRIADIRYEPRRDASGKVDGFYVFVQDVTAQRDAEAGLAAERDRLWDLSEDLLVNADYEGRLLQVSPSWTVLLGHDEETLLTRPYAEIVHPDDFPVVMEALLDMRATGRPVRFEDRVKAADGTWRWIAWKLAPEPGGTRLTGVGRDISAEKGVAEEKARLEEQLRQAQKMEAVGQLTGGLAHDFNNLLAGISGSLELMQTRMAQGRLTDLDRYMTAAQGASKRAAALTHRLLAFSRRQTLDPKPTDVNALVHGMEELIRRTVGPEIEVEVVGASGLWPALVDPHQLENALLNLCINARDAMPRGGRITVETANKWLDEYAARKHDIPTGQYLSLCVTDTGTGMSPDVIGKAFDPFFTTKPIGQGTGLGLSMIYGFAKQSGGQVRIYSEVGEGTTVCIYLPRHHGAVDEDDPLAGLGDVQRAEQGETVLVVDDEPTVRMLVTEVLEDLGYTAIEAADSASGLKVLQSDVRIDLLITDVGLPGGMNGRQMADAGRERRPGLKVLFITGYAENAVVGNGHLEPGMAVLTKPFVVEALGVRIREMIAHG
ncbi:PAS domain S-box-containing protein [Methylobacterium sp. BE186]|uniref:PAS domain S-box protein n=1 Tax=Methylobacterium sp. BE186 TaxID=2817715 RepID=UPI0028672CD0|nr:PAS domain S-box protein [Methylobacterium sp. BE186]MDR7040287.1 PAS domain S-box-containing protein [Methylobacterium sp. BE186]